MRWVIVITVVAHGIEEYGTSQKVRKSVAIDKWPGCMKTTCVLCKGMKLLQETATVPCSVNCSVLAIRCLLINHSNRISHISPSLWAESPLVYTYNVISLILFLNFWIAVVFSGYNSCVICWIVPTILLGKYYAFFFFFFQWEDWKSYLKNNWSLCPFLTQNHKQCFCYLLWLY